MTAEVRETFRAGLATSLRPDDLLTALGAVIDGLLQESAELKEIAAKIGPQLRSLKR